SKVFADFDREPTAAASLAQVHRAYLRDGRAVVVKVQRPGVREQIVEDLEALEQVAEFIDAHTEVGKRYEYGTMMAALSRRLMGGCFHADPHPGNVFLTEDDRIALLDLGMVAHITATFQDNLLRLLLVISEGRGDEAAEISMSMGEPKPNFDKTDFTHRVGN